MAGLRTAPCRADGPVLRRAPTSRASFLRVLMVAMLWPAMAIPTALPSTRLKPTTTVAAPRASRRPGTTTQWATRVDHGVIRTWHRARVAYSTMTKAMTPGEAVVSQLTQTTSSGREERPEVVSMWEQGHYERTVLLVFTFVSFLLGVP